MKEAQRVATEGAISEITSWIVKQLEAETEGGKKTSPTMLVLLETLENTLGSKKPKTDHFGLWKTKKDEIQRLKLQYGEWEPIYKWQGEE